MRKSAESAEKCGNVRKRAETCRKVRKSAEKCRKVRISAEKWGGDNGFESCKLSTCKHFYEETAVAWEAN